MNEDLSFARYYRPSSLEGYIGNTSMKDTVRRVLSSGKRPQSILLTGNTGCGKTTLARIIASWYMCDNPNEDGSPCGECFNCENMKDYIMTGNFEALPDIKEVDITDKSGKTDMNILLEEIEYPAYGGNWKVYILDECHAMSDSAGTRLLKVVEEPPEKVLLIFCTTDPQKMLETLKNRCQLKLQVEKPSTLELTGLLKGVCDDRGKDYDVQGLRMICSRADFVIRDALNDLETVLSSCGDAKAESISKQFKEVNDNFIFAFFKAYLNKDYLGYINILYKIRVEFGFNLFIKALSTFTIRGIYILNNVSVEGLSSEEINSYLDIFSKFSTKDIANLLSKLQKMSYGDVEANLMAFIYTVDEPTSPSQEEVTVSVSTSTIQEENAFRNNNLKVLEKAKVESNQKKLTNYLDKVGVDDVLDMFNLEKIEK